MSREEILLKEYETCQSYVNSLGSQFWVSMTIFMSINIVVIGGITYSIIQNGGHLPNNTKPLILIIAGVLIAISWLLKVWQRRVQFITNLNNIRMRDIEDELVIDDNLVMRRNWMIHGLDLYYDARIKQINNKRVRDRLKQTKELVNRFKFFKKRWPKKQCLRRICQILYALWLVIWLPIEPLVFLFISLLQIIGLCKTVERVKYIPPLGDLIISSIFYILIIIWVLIISLSLTMFS